MSGLEYEVRVAAVNDDGQSIWSPSVRITAPALRLSPADAIMVVTAGPYELGDLMQVHLGRQRPFTRRSPWVWSVCDPDGSGCELLPVLKPTSAHFVGEAARGKRVQVQVDYDKDGSSWTATAVLGVVSRETPPLFIDSFPTFPGPVLPPGCEEAAPSSVADAFAAGVPLHTHLHHLESKSVQVSWDNARGGAIEPLCNDLLVMKPWGRIALVRPGGSVAHLEGRVPMNLEGLKSHPDIAALRSDRFRVADVLLKQHSEERWELFVTHHYFTEECIRFRLSSTTVLRQGASISVSRSWRTILDAEPCIPIAEKGLHQAGGRILADGPDHLLVVIGSHSRKKSAREPDSHLGKLVRIAIETGEPETLSVGLRNPQGFVRDADGNLWETEHGPQGGDELNLLEPGADYGWPFVSYGVQYGRELLRTVPDESTGRHAGFARPVFAWVPSIAVSAMIVNDERWFPLWKDDLLIGSLSGGGNGRSIFRVRRNGTDVQYVERIEVGYRVRDLTWMPDGRMAVLADGGRVHFLSRSSVYCGRQSRLSRLVYAVGCGRKDGDAAQAPAADRHPPTAAPAAPPDPER